MRAFAVLAFIIGLVALTRPAASADALAAAFSGDTRETRIVLELSDAPGAVRIFAADGPPRLVLDLDGVRFRLGADTAALGLVTDWRHGPLDPQTGRVVLDLAAPALVARQFFLPALAGRPGRLVIDLTAVSAERFQTAAASAIATAPPAPAPTRAAVTVVLDPGHGGIDPGAVSPDGVPEKTVALAFAERLKADLDALGGIETRLTREDDRFLSLNRRIRIARAYGADLFISLHADTAPQDYVQGATVYTLSQRASDADAAALAARENLADEISGAVEPEAAENVSSILADLLRRETKTLSHRFAETLVKSLGDAVTMNKRPHRSARFRVLFAHDFPSVLLELGYLTNAEDAARLSDPAWQARASAAVANAVRDFVANDTNTHHTGLSAAERSQ
ncbi:MAG: N-acetylmuramoyl-L-alanine amidase [Pseudomonadota bacterium]